MIVEPLTVEHARALVVQPWQSVHAAALHDADLIRGLTAAGPAFAARDGKRILGIAGIDDHGFGRGMAWCWLAADLRQGLVGVTWAIRRFLRSASFDRLEIVTHADFPEAHTWASLLGFEFEAPLRAYFPPREGESFRRPAFLWSRVRNG